MSSQFREPDQGPPARSKAEVGLALDEGRYRTSKGRLDGKARLQAGEDSAIGTTALLDVVGPVPLALEGIG